VALQALCLEKINKKKYQKRIAQCAQFLVDNQCENGQWGYGEPVKSNPEYEFETPQDKNPKMERPEDLFEPPDKKKDSQPGPGPRDQSDKKSDKNAQDGRQPGTGMEEIKVPPIKSLKKRQKGPPAGDNSNSQYAALGLKACYEAGIVLPKEVVELAKKWWESTMSKDSGWDYNGYKVITESYGSMVAGGIGSLIIYDQIQGADFKKNNSTLYAFNWLAKNHKFDQNPNGDKSVHKDLKAFHYYYIYAFERALGLYGSEWFGKVAWYKEGADFLLSKQNADGSWFSGKEWGGDNALTDTCFAILFLRRVTKPVEPPKLIEIETDHKRK
jgi:hypothetical protein